MQALIADPVLAQRIGACARETAGERFGLNRFARDWNRAFAEVLELGGRSRLGRQEVLL
jgi:hypothetical protein